VEDDDDKDEDDGLAESTVKKEVFPPAKMLVTEGWVWEEVG